MKETILIFTTATGGAATTVGERALLGKLYAIEYQPGNTATGATLTVTCENGVYSKPLLTLANAGIANIMLYPLDIVHKVEDGAVLTGTSGGDRCKPLLNGKPKIVVASGGDAKTGLIIVYYEE